MKRDAHARPPASIRELFKEWRKRPVSQIESDLAFIDPNNPDPLKVTFVLDFETRRSAELDAFSNSFCGEANTAAFASQKSTPGRAFEVKGLPGRH